MNEPPYRWLYAGLICAIVANVLVIGMNIATGVPMFAASASAIAVSGGALWLIRQRQKGRL